MANGSHEPPCSTEVALSVLGRECSPAQPTARHPLLERARRSVWAPVAAKMVAIALGMLGLAAIGTASILSGQNGVKISPQPPLAADVGAAWLAAGGDAQAPAPAHSAGKALAGGACGPGALCGGDAAANGPRGITADGKVILNVASAEELTRLPGVGRKRAEAIVKLRARLKRFRRFTDLLRVRGIGVRSLKRMLPHMVLDRPEPPDAG